MSQPKFIIDFIHNGEVLGALFQRINKLGYAYSVLKEQAYSVLNDKVLELEKATILHKLSQFPLNDDQMTSIMDIIKTGKINPSAKDAKGYTFLELSPIVDKLSRRIYIANDSWIKNLWRVKKMKNWIKLRNDRLLLDIFKRMSILMSSSSFQTSEIRDPLRLARPMWREKTNFPEAFKEFLALTAKYHDNDKSKLKRMCKKYLSSSDDEASTNGHKRGAPVVQQVGNLNLPLLNPQNPLQWNNNNVKPAANSINRPVLDIALPFFKELTIYTLDQPKVGYFLMRLFSTFMGLSLILRGIDAITDVTLTIAFYQSWDTVLTDFHKLALPCNRTENCTVFLRSQCKNEFKDTKIACSLTNMDGGWIPGTISLLILGITYFSEVFSTTLTTRRTNYEHYWTVFSGACCKAHRRFRIYSYALILPLFQQIPSLVYEHWMISFVIFWKKKNTHLADNIKRKLAKDCNKCRNCSTHDSKDEICVYCSKNSDNLEKLDELNHKAHEIANHSKNLVASTENLLMPMIQLAFIFPPLVATLSQKDIDVVPEPLIDPNPITKVFNTVTANWTTILIVSSTLSSLVSLTASQTSIYFSSEGKQNQKTFTTRTFIFIVIILQVIPKVLAFQAFVFGIIRYPNFILPVCLILPYFSSLLKSFLVWTVSGCSFKINSIWGLLVSPFIMTKLEDKQNLLDDDHSRNEDIQNCVMTETGKNHIIFDILSFLENAALVITGSIGLMYIEKSFMGKYFCGMVMGTHMFGLLLKAIYYRHQHPWMSLSQAYKGMGLTLNVILGIFLIIVIVSMPLFGYFLAMDQTTSIILYILTGLTVAMVRITF